MTVTEPTWIPIALAKAIHARQIAEHGGGDGIRDAGKLESALARPQQRFAEGGKEVDIPALAAAYAFGIARNHPFMDGNKGTAYVVLRTFLILAGWELVCPLADRYPVFLALAAGELDEAELTDWLRANTRADRVSEAGAVYS